MFRLLSIVELKTFCHRLFKALARKVNIGQLFFLIQRSFIIWFWFGILKLTLQIISDGLIVVVMKTVLHTITHPTNQRLFTVSFDAFQFL